MTIQTKAATPQYRDNWDAIFKKEHVHTWQCFLDGKHGHMEYWECKECGESWAGFPEEKAGPYAKP